MSAGRSGTASVFGQLHQALDAGDLAGACDLLQANLRRGQISPVDAHRLCESMVLAGAHAQAALLLRRLVATAPAYWPAALTLGQLLADQGSLEEALSLLEHARRQEPGGMTATSAIAEIHLKSGDAEAAMRCLEPHLDDGETPLPVACVFAEAAPMAGREEEAVALLEKVLEKGTGQASPLGRRACFALGRLHDRAGNMARAFEMFRKGNQGLFDAGRAQVFFNQIRVLRETFAQPAESRSGQLDQTPVFIVGLPRSGTTLVEQILASHARVVGGGELPYIGLLLNSFPQRFGREKRYPAAVPRLGVEQLDALGRDYLDKLRAHDPEADRITDKMPHNFLHLGLIDRILPGARVIWCHRNPLDTCLSIYSHYLSANHPYAADLETLGRYYLAVMELKRHWEKVCDIPMLTLNYESLVADPETVTRELLVFCGLDWDPACLRFFENARMVSTYSHAQVRRPLYRSSIGRWKKYRRELQPLIDIVGEPKSQEEM